MNDNIMLSLIALGTTMSFVILEFFFDFATYRESFLIDAIIEKISYNAKSTNCYIEVEYNNKMCSIVDKTSDSLKTCNSFEIDSTIKIWADSDNNCSFSGNSILDYTLMFFIFIVWSLFCGVIFTGIFNFIYSKIFTKPTEYNQVETHVTNQVEIV